jgi:hypothetical protein
MRAVRVLGTRTQASHNEASFFPDAPVRPSVLQPISLAIMTAAIIFGEFPLVLRAISKSPFFANASIWRLKILSNP